LKLTETLEKCPNCSSLFYKFLPSRAELLARLDGKESRYIYCSENCLKTKLQNMNSGSVPMGVTLRIKNETRFEKTNQTPIIYIIDFVASYPKLEGTHVS
jgi:hypothetical protein